MNSLHGRLLIGICSAILLFWCGWGVFASWWTWRDEDGFADSSLRETASIMMDSLPDRFVTGTATACPQRAPSKSAAPASTIGMAFEVWVSGRCIIRSQGSPPLPPPSPDRSGFDTLRLGDRAYRSYVVHDPARGASVRVVRDRGTWRAMAMDGIRFGLLNSLLLAIPLLLILRWVMRWSFKPVAILRMTLQDKPAMDFSPLPVAGLPIELHELVDAFNRTLERLRLSIEREKHFISDAAHELRTPLAALAAQAHIALHATDMVSKDAAIFHLSQGVARSARLSEQLLALARLDAKADSLDNAPVNLAEVVAHVIRDFEHTARKKPLQLTLQLAPAVVWGNLDELGILLRNLIDNAVRFTEPGGYVACTVHVADGKHREVVLSVADNGPGVPEDERRLIFERFYRASGCGSNGTGIGLSLVSRIARLHQARITVGVGLYGRGFRVNVHFPEWLDPAGFEHQGATPADVAVPDG